MEGLRRGTKICRKDGTIGLFFYSGDSNYQNASFTQFFIVIGCTNTTCRNNSHCVVSPSAVNCTCDEGYQSDFVGVCVDIDACWYSPCGQFANCTDLPPPAGPGLDGRDCVCPHDYTFASDNRTCVFYPESVASNGVRVRALFSSEPVISAASGASARIPAYQVCPELTTWTPAAGARQENTSDEFAEILKEGVSADSVNILEVTYTPANFTSIHGNLSDTVEGCLLDITLDIIRDSNSQNLAGDLSNFLLTSSALNKFRPLNFTVLQTNTAEAGPGFWDDDAVWIAIAVVGGFFILLGFWYFWRLRKAANQPPAEAPLLGGGPEGGASLEGGHKQTGSGTNTTSPPSGPSGGGEPMSGGGEPMTGGGTPTPQGGTNQGKGPTGGGKKD